ncbi:cytochrome P450 [Rhypophila sp. PSN 637]
MHTYLAVCLWAFGSWAILNIIDSYWRYFSYDAKRAKQGCQRAPRIPNKYPFGLDFFRDAAKADKEKTFPEMMIKRYGTLGPAVKTFEHYTLGNHGISTNDPKNIQAVLATKFKDFGLGERRNSTFRPLLGRGIFAVDGPSWEHSRALIRPQFARHQISDLEQQERHTQHLMRALPTDSSGWTCPTNLLTLFFRLTLDRSTEFLFGESVNSQLINLPETLGKTTQKVVASDNAIDEVTFAQAFDGAQGWLSDRSRLLDKYWMDDGPGRRRVVRIVHEFVNYFVRRALGHRKQRAMAGEKDAESNQSNKPYVFLEELACETQDPIELRDQLCSLLFAGRDTTASFLSWTFWLLVRHPYVFEKLRKSILTSFGAYQAAVAGDTITLTGLKDCSYLQAVLNETLRLFPVVPVNMRQALRDTTLPTGGGPDGKSPIFVAKGQIVDYSVFVLQRTKEYWGEDADMFRPERWEGRKFGWDYLPFNGGPRICLGQQFALTVAGYTIVRLLQRFDKIENLDSDTEPTHNLSLVDNPFKGVRVRLHEADSP